MTDLYDPTRDIPPPTDRDYIPDDDGHYGSVVALRGELIEHRPALEPADTMADIGDGYRATDVGNAERFINAADGRVRYVHLWQRWIVYTGGRWVLDANDALVTQIAKQVARALFRAAGQAEGDGVRERLWAQAKHCEKANVIANMIRLARAIPGVIVTHEELDARPWLFNAADCTIDLRSGIVREHDPADLLTKQSPVSYDPDARAPLWEQCLETWQPDEAVRGFLQRAVGSGAVGHPVETLIVNVGGGGNGKGKFYGAISGVLGDYCAVPDKSLLVKQRHEPHPTVIAKLHGARMLIAGETDDGDRLDEASVKNLTGGDKLSGRRMREDPWEFWPTHTAFLHTNHPPRIRGTDNGIWRRLRIVQWDTTIPDEQIDEHLAAKLAREAPGILAWIVSGARQWAQEGLEPPQAVLDATKAYRASEDHVGRFLADCVTLDDRFSTPASELREAYEKWCSETGEEPWSAKRMGSALSQRGIDSARVGSRNIRVWVGLDLNREVPASDGCRPLPTSSAHSPREMGLVTGKQEEAVGSGRDEQMFGTVTGPELTDEQFLAEPF